MVSGISCLLSMALKFMTKKHCWLLICLVLHAFVSHSSTVTDLDDWEFSQPAPLESLLSGIRASFDLPDEPFLSIDRDASTRISQIIHDAENLYKRAKHGDNEALTALKIKAKESAYACVLMMKYYAKRQATEGASFSPEYELFLSDYLSFLGDQMMGVSTFVAVEDPLLNISLAAYHRMSNAYSLATQFAQVAINQGCVEGYNIIGAIDKTVDSKRAVVSYFKAAQYENPRGLYKLARLYDSLKGGFSKDLYKHAALRGFSKAYFALGRYSETEHQRRESFQYFSKLIEIDPYSYVYLEQKEGLGRTAFYVAKKLFRKHSPLLVPLLKSIYSHNPLKRKTVSHLLALGYSLGKYGFPSSRDDARYWLTISARMHGDVEDAYQLCCLSSPYQHHTKESSEEDLIPLGRRLVHSELLTRKYGLVPQILFARLLAEEGENCEDSSPFFEESAHWLLNALSCLEQDFSRRRRIVWHIPKTHIQGEFYTVENAYQEAVMSASTSSEKQKTLYELGFHHLWGGLEGAASLTKAGQCFLQLGQSSSNASYFYVTVIHHYFSAQRLMHSLHDPLEGEMVFNRQLPMAFTQEQIEAVFREARLNKAAAHHMLGLMYLLGCVSDHQVIEANLSLARENFEKAASENHVKAMLNLANGFRNGWFGVKNADHALYWYQEASRRKNTKATYQLVAQLLDKRDDLEGTERNLLKKKVRELSYTHLEEAALSLALWFRLGMYGLSSSLEHEIYWLKLAAAKGNHDAQKILNIRYPLVSPLTEEDTRTLCHFQTHTGDQPNLLVIGGGISGITTALLFAKAAEEGKISIGKIRLVEQQSHLLKEASMIVARQHRGGEYGKDRTTATQCLYGSALWGQLYRTERMLTERKLNDFLLAKASCGHTGGDHTSDDALSEEELIAHYTFLNGHYKAYLSQLVSSGKHDRMGAEKLLFGPPPLFHNLESEELRALHLDHHFAAGISTTERGFQPVGMGVLLEYLLHRYNIEVITDYEVTGIEPLAKEGLRIKGRGRQSIETRYLINAAWHNNSHLAWLLKNSQLNETRTETSSSLSSESSAKRVFLRCLALADTSQCSLPKDRSFFGVVGEQGGMVSCFNDQIAAIFIPQEGLSYQGEYDLDESAVNDLPYAARRKLFQLETEKMALSQKILANAKTKYPFLEGAEAKGFRVQTTVSENNEIFKRTHSPAKWVEGAEDCLQVCSTKATFAPFVALQALARFVADKPRELQANFDEEESRFLTRLIDTNLFKEGTVENADLPDCFKLILDDGFMSEKKFQARMRHYAFQRGMDFALFEKEVEAEAAGMDPNRQFKLVSQEEELQKVDIESHTLTAGIVDTLFSLLERTNVELSEVKLGSLGEEADDDEADELGGMILNQLQKVLHLRRLTLRDWNLTFSSRYRPLGALFSKLEEVHLKEMTLTLKSVHAFFESGVSLRTIKKISIVNSNPKEIILTALINGIQRCETLEFLDLSGNGIPSAFLDKGLEKLVKELKQLKYLSLHDNKLFEGISLMSAESSSLPPALEANPFLLAVVDHPHLERVDVINNGPASYLVQDRLDFYFYQLFK